MAKWFSDLGHGGNDPGAVSTKGVKESNICLAAGLEFKRVMEANGEVVKLSRESDKTLSLTERTNMANSLGADYVVSKHVNSAVRVDAQGTETFIYRDSGNTVDNKSKKLAQLCNKHTLNAVKEMGIVPIDRGVKVGNLHMVRETVAPACLVELDFISNPNIASKLNGTIYGRHLAYACLEMVGKKVNNNQNNNEKVEYDMKYLVCYGNSIDARVVPYLTDALGCGSFDANIPSTEYKNVEVLIAVGGNPPSFGKFSGHTKYIVKDTERWDTAEVVAKVSKRIAKGEDPLKVLEPYKVK